MRPSKCDDYAKIRHAASVHYLDVLKYIRQGIDPHHDYERNIYRNIPSLDLAAINPELWEETGLSSEEIQDIIDKSTQAHEKRVWDNSVLTDERRVQMALTKLEPRIQDALDRYFIIAYARSPRADGELVELLEKHGYPEERKNKIFQTLGIPPFDFRDWESNEISGKLFKETAKFVSLDGDVVTLERADGSTATIDYFDLRGSDKEFIGRQIEVPMWRFKWLDGRIITGRLTLGDEPIFVLELEGRTIHQGVLADFPADWEDVELYLMKYVHEFGRKYFPTELGPETTVTETTVAVPYSEIRVEQKPRPAPLPPPPLYSNRLKIGLTIYAVFIAIVFALYFYFRFRWQRRQSAS